MILICNIWDKQLSISIKTLQTRPISTYFWTKLIFQQLHQKCKKVISAEDKFREEVNLIDFFLGYRLGCEPFDAFLFE